LTAEIPPQVKNLNYVDLGATAVTLTWARPQTAILAPIQSYFINIITQPTGESHTLKISGDKTSFTLTGLRPKTTYSFNIYAINKKGKGKKSNFPDVDTLAAALTPGNILIWFQFKMIIIYKYFKILTLSVPDPCLKPHSSFVNFSQL